MALQIGETVGDYQIVGVLGKGGMGKVYKVRNLLSDRIEAMKVVLPDLSADPALADRFLREIRVHASLEHPNIAALRTALRVNNQVLMVMELVEGSSLEERLKQGTVDLASSLHYVEQVLSALELAHSRGIIHRDIKPANIIVTPEGTVKLTDFGIARSASDATLTQSGVALGSLYYMSPEQVQAQPVDPRSDIYSVGVTFYEMVTGKRPIDGSSEYAILNAHLTHTPPTPLTLNPAVPIMLSAAIMKAIAKNPEERFQSAAEMREALRRTEGFTTLTSVVTETISAVPADPGRAQVEDALMKAIGPIARVLVARTAPLCANASELRDRLAAQIENPQDRQAFLKRLTTGTVSGPQTPSSGRPKVDVITQWDPVVIANAKQQLAVYAGPIASVIVDRAAKKTRTPYDLYQMLASEIPSARDRAAFLKHAPISR